MALKNDEIYGPASIVQFAKDNRLLRAEDRHQEKLEKMRMRIVLGRLARKYGFPLNGDGLVAIPLLQVWVPGWFGWRWKQILRDE